MRARFALSLLAAAGCATGARAGRPADVPGRPAAEAPAIRGPAGQIPLTTMSGRPTTLAEHGARVTVVALWATYCGPCLEELPIVDELYRRYRGRSDVSVIAVNVEDTSEASMRAQVAQVLDQLSIEMPSLLDGQEAMLRLTEHDQAGEPRLALPLLVVVDPAFRIHRRFGFAPSISRARYVAGYAALIEAALRGEEPEPAPPRR